MNEDKIPLDKLVDWTVGTIHYYLKHRANESDKLAYLDKIIDYCKKTKENV